MEEWRDINGYEGIYQISSYGRVKSIDRVLSNGKKRKSKFLYIHKINGYPTVSLCKDYKQRNYKIHRLVAQAFIPNIENKPCIDHINCIRDDNRVENLRWVTHKENMNNPVSTAKLSSARKKYYLNEDNLRRNRQQKHNKAVVQLSIEGEVVGEYQSIRDAQRQTGIGVSSIFNCIKQYTHTAGGFKWQYKE